MTAVNAPVSSNAAGALSAFLRGVERRALVVAELQCGDSTVAEQALVAVMRAFAGIASDVPMAQWPDRFWILLAHRTPIRVPAAGGQWAPELSHLPQLAPPARLALLLRVGGGLDEAAAAQILDMPVADYQHALAEAWPELTDAVAVPDASRFPVDSWWAVQCDPVAGGHGQLRYRLRQTALRDIMRSGDHARAGEQLDQLLLVG